MKHISVVCGTLNEEENVRELYDRLTRVFREQLPHYDYTIIVIDNASTDRTVAVLKDLARDDKRLRIIVNNRNFGHIRSGYHALMQAPGEAAVIMASDLQDPPEMIPRFVEQWERGFKIVLAQKTNSKESPLFFLIRKTYYSLVARLSEIDLVKNATGFGLYDRTVIEDIKRINDPYPYFRGLICDLGYERALIPFTQPVRTRGFTKNNFYTLYDMAMLGITNHSKVPLRLAAFSGFCIAALSFSVALGYLIYKLLYWDQFQVGTAPLVIGLFFFGAVQLFFVGILGEYIGSIHTQVLRRPPVIEKERINFDEPGL
ncbi:MAG TPA: glycosyltransferase family 2 protein [Bryobacteraceae bacterium]|nr:glycosyltransferase family 2 protein [Bryobacteraceae bacterium]